MTNIEVFPKFDQNLNFSKSMTKIEKFSKILTKTKFFPNFDQNRNFFRKFDQNRKFSKSSKKTKFFENLTKIDIFRYFPKFWPKSISFSKIWPKSKFFWTFDQNRNFDQIEISRKFDQNRNFSKLSKMSNFFANFYQKSKFFENLTKIEIFRKFI